MAAVLTNEQAGYSEEQIAKIATATEYKEKADDAFKKGEMKAALLSYHTAIMYCKGIDKSPAAAMSSGTDANDPDKKKPMTEVDVMTEKIYGNMSAAHVKLGNWKRAEETADACLKKNPDNTKALFRKAKALGEQGFYERAEPLLQDLLKKSPAEAPSINAELKRLAAMDREREKAARQKLKGWMSRDKGEKTESKADEETTPAGPPPVSSATIEEVA